MDSEVNTLLIIPARLKSSRLAEKLLLKIHGIEVIVWVAKRAIQTKHDAIVAVDDDKLAAVLDQHDIPWIMTSKHHQSGTARATEVQKKIPQYDFYCLVQGDEPLLSVENVETFVEMAIQENAPYVQAVTRFVNQEIPQDKSNVKAVLGSTGELIYASRSLVPFNYNKPINHNHLYQISGLYLFNGSFLNNYASLDKCDLEEYENIEQLRCLFYGIKIKAIVVEHGMHSVDTIEDYEFLTKNTVVRDGKLELK